MILVGSGPMRRNTSSQSNWAACQPWAHVPEGGGPEKDFKTERDAAVACAGDDVPMAVTVPVGDDGIGMLAAGHAQGLRADSRSRLMLRQARRHVAFLKALGSSG